MISYENYAKFRNSQGLKDSEVAKMANIPQSTFSDWKKGKSTPKMEKLQKIADALHISYFELTGPVGKFSSYYPNRKMNYEMTNKEVEIIEALRDSDQNQTDPDDLKKAVLIVAYLKQLNEAGFNEALKRIEELTQLDKYRKEEE